MQLGTSQLHAAAPRVACAEEVRETVDAVTGATWGTRNRIMEDLFFRDLDRHADEMPVYKPPGVE